MSLEAAIKALTEAVEANTAAIESGGGSTKATSSGKSTSKPAEKKETTKKATTVDQLAKKAGAYLSAGSAADKKAAKANVTKIVEHFEVDRLTEVDEDKFDEVIAMIDAFENGDDPLEGEGGDDDALV